MPILQLDSTKSREEQLISKDDFRRCCEAEGINSTKVWALIPQWTESGPRVEGTKSALVSSDLILRSNGTVVSLDKLMWPWSKGLADKHVAGQSNPRGLPWDEFVITVTKLESDSSRIAREIMDKQQGGKWDEKTPYPYYAGDTGWSWDRDQRDDKLGAIMDQDRLYTKPPREHSKETLAALRALIEETEDAVRNSLETHAGMTWLEQSIFVQGLLYDWFRATQNRVV